MIPAAKRALFLDRDGVINIDLDYVYLPEQTQWVPGIFALCKKAQDLGFCIVVITNQAGIARGYYSEAQFQDYTHWLHAQFADRGLSILATYHCPHHPTEGLGAFRLDCNCRKPKPGMIFRAAQDWNLDLYASALIGDKASDISAGRAAGIVHCLKVDTGPEKLADAVTLDDAENWLASLIIQP